MLEIISDWRTLYARHTVEKLGLIALLCQASHFPVFDWLLTSLTYLTQSANILSVTTQVYLPFQCGAAAPTLRLCLEQSRSVISCTTFVTT